MKQESASLGLLRTFLMSLGSYLIGKNVFGIDVDASVFQELIGFVIAIGVFIWSFASKTTTIEGFQGVLRQFFTFAGGILLSKGWITNEILVSVVALIPTIGPAIYAYLSRIKSQKLDDGSIKIDQLLK